MAFSSYSISFTKQQSLVEEIPSSCIQSMFFKSLYIVFGRKVEYMCIIETYIISITLLEIALALIRKSHHQSASQIFKNWPIDFHIARDVSTATSWNMKRRPSISCMAIFLSLAESTTAPTASADRVSFEDAKMVAGRMCE